MGAEMMNEELMMTAGKHERLVENLQEKYGLAQKGALVDESFGNNIAQSIEALPNIFRRVVLLSDVEELRYAEIAKTLACPVGTVCSRLHRGRKVLQQRLVNFPEVNETLLRKFEDSDYLQKDNYT